MVIMFNFLVFIVAFINIAFILQMTLIVLYEYFKMFDKIRLKIQKKNPDLFKEYPNLRNLLNISADMDLRVNYYWSLLREETRKGFKRRRIDKNQELIKIKLLLFYI